MLSGSPAITPAAPGFIGLGHLRSCCYLGHHLAPTPGPSRQLQAPPVNQPAQSARLSAPPSPPVSCCHPCLNPSRFLSLLFCVCPPGLGSPVPPTGFPTLLQYLSSPPCFPRRTDALFLCYYTGFSVCAVWASMFPQHFPVFLPANYIKVPSSRTRAASESDTHPIQPSQKS